MAIAVSRLLRRVAVAGVIGSIAGAAAGADFQTVEALGEALFFDPDLSANRTQSCATCHNPDFGFADPRDSGTPAGRAASLGATATPRQPPMPASSRPSGWTAARRLAACFTMAELRP